MLDVGKEEGFTKWTQVKVQAVSITSNTNVGPWKTPGPLVCYCWISEKIPPLQNQERAAKTCLTCYLVQPWVLQMKTLGYVICPWSHKTLIKVALESRTKSKTFKKKTNTTRKTSFLTWKLINSFAFTQCRHLLTVYCASYCRDRVNKNKTRACSQMKVAFIEVRETF